MRWISMCTREKSEAMGTSFCIADGLVISISLALWERARVRVVRIASDPLTSILSPKGGEEG